ncbi:hypothetical protein [Mycobacterium europaeum]|uniref:phage terminase small subunit n=1 Tax=Mycobacterium europaeum TaxID=761804 RepID=UPI001AD7F86A|nr:hypothetical protein [Mycobacterium europaeum]
MRVIRAEPVEQPKLPPLMQAWIDSDGRERSKRIAWPAQTKKWWQMWADSPLSDDFTSTDWSELLDTARLHAEYWRGNLKVAAELRLRVAKFGATPEDRARLRIQFAVAENAENRPASVGSVPANADQPAGRPRRAPIRHLLDSNDGYPRLVGAVEVRDGDV